MNPAGPAIPYPELVALANKLFEECDEDARQLTRRLEMLDTDLRNELLVSDLLNAYQAFYYFFRLVPDELVVERLELEPASALVRGVKIDEINLLELHFFIKNMAPVVVVSDGEQVLATFSGRTAYANGMKYLENPEYQ